MSGLDVVRYHLDTGWYVTLKDYEALRAKNEELLALLKESAKADECWACGQYYVIEDRVAIENHRPNCPLAKALRGE